MMWTTLSVSRWIFLLTLAVVMLTLASPVVSGQYINIPCCRTVGTTKIRNISACFEQMPRYGCNVHAFLIKGVRSATKLFCISPNATWLKEKINKGLKCPPVLS